MGLFEKLPYTNFHRVNLDWIIRKLKEMDAKLDEIVSDHDAVVDLQTRMIAAEGNITALSGRMTTAEGKLNKIPLPSASDIGKVLGAVVDGSGAKLEYVPQSGGSNVPTPGSGDSGKVLTAGSGGSMSWESAPSGGSGKVIRNGYVTYAEVFVDDSDLAPVSTYTVMNQIAADMNAARLVSKAAMQEVYNRVEIRINGRTLPPDSLGWDQSAKYNTSSERFDYWPTEEAQTAKVSGTWTRLFYRGATFKLYIPISGTPALEYTAPTGYADLTGGTLSVVTGVSNLDDRMAERMIVEVYYNRAN